MRVMYLAITASLALLLVNPNTKQAIPIQWAPSTVVAADGSTANPSINFGSSAGTGFSISGGVTTYSKSGVGQYTVANNGFTLGSGVVLGWSSNADSSLAAADITFVRRAANEFGISNVLFAALGTPANGTFAYCSDCTIANPCASGGTGAFAKRLNGVWVCN